MAVVTGASGGGAAIAQVLGEEGATVYVTGRSVRGRPTTLNRPGTIEDTAEAVTARGGRGIPVRCDHRVDAEVAALFERVRGEQGRVHLLVNNAWGGYELSFLGRAVVALAADPDVREKSGRLLTVIELAREYGFTDVDGSQISPFWIEHYGGE